MTWVNPDLHIIYTDGKYKLAIENAIWRFIILIFLAFLQTLANNFDTMHPRFLILHCLEYGKYGITPTMLRAELVLQAYAMINNSIILLLTSLKIQIQIQIQKDE